MHIGKLHSRPSSSASNHYSAQSPAHLLPTRNPSLSSKWPPPESPSPLLLVRKPMASYGVGFLPASIAVHVLGLVLIVLTLTWVISFRGGVSLFTSDSNQIFNAHPVIQIGGYIFISSEAVLVYKTLSGPKKTKKLVHLSLQAVAFLFALLGIWAAYKNHIDTNVDNFYSLHSWLGITTVSLFFIQWLIGFVSFWLQSVGPSTRSAVLPWHVFLGLLVFVLMIATATSGFLEKMTFLNINAGIGHYATETLFVNSTGLILVLFGIVTILAALIPSPNSEDGYQPIN